MTLKWKDVPAHILALGNLRAIQQDRSPLKLNNDCGSGFIWASTPEGREFWNKVSEGEFGSYTSEPIYEIY